MLPMSNAAATVANERQARALAPLGGDPTAMREAVEEVSANGAPTAASLADAVGRRLPGPKTAERLARERGEAALASDRCWHTGKKPGDQRHGNILFWASTLEREPFPPSRGAGGAVVVAGKLRAGRAPVARADERPVGERMEGAPARPSTNASTRPMRASSPAAGGSRSTCSSRRRSRSAALSRSLSASPMKRLCATRSASCAAARSAASPWARTTRRTSRSSPDGSARSRFCRA